MNLSRFKTYPAGALLSLIEYVPYSRSEETASPFSLIFWISFPSNKYRYPVNYINITHGYNYLFDMCNNCFYGVSVPDNEFIINCDDDVIIPEFGIKDIENY